MLDSLGVSTGTGLPDDANPKNLRVIELKRSGPSLHERTGRRRRSAVRATAGVTPLGLVGECLPPRSAPYTIRTRHETAAVHRTPPYPVQGTHMHRATARRDSPSPSPPQHCVGGS